MLKNFMKEEKKLMKGLKTKYFHFIMIKSMSMKWKLKEKKKEEEEGKKKRKEQKKKQDEKTTDPNKFNEWINEKETDITNEFFMNHFNFQRLSNMF